MNCTERAIIVLIKQLIGENCPKITEKLVRAICNGDHLQKGFAAPLPPPDDKELR